MHPPIETNNIVEFTCPLSKQWKFGLLFHGKAAESELEKFYAHSEKCKICAIKAVEFLKLEIPGCKKSIQPRKNTLALAIAALLIICIIPCFYYSTKTLPSEIILSQNTTNNLYEELDFAIDSYLNTADSKYLDQADRTAKQISNHYKDIYGIKLVEYYRSTPPSKSLWELREKLKNLFGHTPDTNYEAGLLRSEELERDFLLQRNSVEALKTQTVRAKMLVFSYKNTAKAVIEDGLQKTEQYQYAYLKTLFLLWESKRLVQNPENHAEYQKGEKLMEQILPVASAMRLNQVKISLAKSLTAIYHMRNEDQKALATAQRVLSDAKDNEDKIPLLEVCGASAFKLGLHDLSNTYMDQALEIAELSKNALLLSDFYIWAGVLATENGDYLEAETHYKKALEYQVKVKNNEIGKKDLASRIFGQRAKNESKAGNYEIALKYYENAIHALKGLEESEALEMSQLNEGLALCLEKTGKESSNYYAIAAYFKKKAENQGRNINCLISYMPTCN